MSTTPRVVVVGAGVAGLATAWLCLERSRREARPIELVVLEARTDAGGATRSDWVDGYLCEWGPNGFLDNEPATLDLIGRLGLESRLVRADEAASHRFIYHSGTMHEVPVKPPAFLRSHIVPWRAKLRMAAEIAIPARRDGADETVAEFGRRRLGPDFAALLLDPMVSGIFAGNTAELSLAAVFPKMAEMERTYGGLFRALLAKSWQARRSGAAIGGPSGPRGALHTFRDGMGELTQRMIADLTPHLQTGAAVASLGREAGRFRIHLIEGTAFRGQTTIDADAVVLACPSHAAAPIVSGLSPRARRALEGIVHAPVDVVCLGYDERDLGRPIRGFGVLVPRREGMRSLGTLLCEQIFPGQAPAGQRLLRTLLGGAHDPGVVALDEQGLYQTVEGDLGVLFEARGEPRFRRIVRHKRGIAQYTVGHLDRVAVLDELERELPGLYFTGASYRGVSVNGCVKGAFDVSRRVAELGDGAATSLAGARAAGASRTETS
jgi:oxygen-dependent protoporphyrinogen oxidase